ncbi:GNAT family N-acetyltransferase [Lactovum miscens]|uniref:N-acetyltransferase domain-containing protein n=1 Tax=Lactovum miscens TaxID=190387 RepID=A0A841CAI5_9LACT|nr:GNAT family N-acetyltransferase [Lactovum miscens]MBB5888728.1 hypothetical protein [Lactovum miscens]
MIYLRQATLSDVSAIVPIINDAKKFLSGFDTDQWQGNYPARSDIERFINNKEGYVLIVDDEVAGFSALIAGEDKAYTTIENGDWTNDNFAYIAVHCIAFSDKYRGLGLATSLFTAVFTLGYERGIKDFRVDTHPNNKIMQHVFEREGFVRRGDVTISDGARWAYQLEL